MSEVKNAQPKQEQKQEQKKEMKKSTRIALIVLSILFFLSAIVTPIVIFTMPRGNQPVEVTEGDFILRFDPKANVYDIVRYIGDSNEVIVPAKIGDTSVRDILPDAFNAEVRSTNRNITKVEIEEGIRNVGANAFKGCESLESLEVPASVQRIGERAFAGSGVKDLKIKDASVLKFEENALADAEHLKKLTIVGASSNLNKGVFGELSGNITDLEIGKGVNVGVGAFDGLDNITTLYVYNFDNLVVERDAFINTNITTLNIYYAEDDLTESFMTKFADLTKLQTINIASEIKNIKQYALSRFNSLTLVTLGNGSNIDISSMPSVPSSQLKVKMITENEGDGLVLNITHDSGNTSYNVVSENFANFFETNRVTNLNLSENFTDIGENAFSAYTSLSRLDFGKNSKIRIIGENAFGGEDDVVNIRVYGPDKGENNNNYVYGIFNRSSGRYHKRLSYNDVTDLGSYYIALDYSEGYGENPKGSVPASYPRTVDILVGDIIGNYLPIETGDNNRIMQGYTLIGWGTTRDKVDVEFTSSEMKPEYNGQILYAIWMPGNNVKYTIKYYVQSLSEPTEYIDYGDPFETENTGTNHLIRFGVTGSTVGGEELKVNIKGFKFVETAQNNKKSKITDTLAPDGTTELYLYYDREQYDIEFNFNDQVDSVTKVDPNNVNWDGVITADRGDKRVSLVYFGGKFGALPTVTRSGYEFLGWYINEDGETMVQEGDNFNYDHGITLYAKWQKTEVKYALEYHMQNADDNNYTKDAGRSNDNVLGTLADDEVVLSPAQIVGFVFEKATFTASYQESEQNIDELKVRICGDGSTVIKLYYTRVTYTINYDKNDQDGGSTQAQVVEPSSLSSISLRYGQRYILPNITRDGYTLKGWNLNKEETGRWITGELLVPSGDVQEGNIQTLYAIWQANAYKVHYDANNEKARNTMEDSSHIFDKESTLSANNFEVDGYHFGGWCLNKSPMPEDKIYTNLESVINLTTEAYDGSDETKGVVTMYATWQPNNYDIVYHANNEKAEGETATSHMVYDQEGQRLTQNGFTVKGYHFKGWVLESHKEDYQPEDIFEDNAIVKNLTTRNNDVVNLYALWEANEYTVVFNGGAGASGSADSIKVKYDQSTTLSNGDGFTYLGYEITGWALRNEDKMSKVYDLSAEVSGSDLIEKAIQAEQVTTYDSQTITLYAVWKAIEYSITLYYNDETGGSEVLNDVTLEGYTLPREHDYPGFALLGFSETQEGEVNSQLSGDITEWLRAKIEAGETDDLKVYMIWEEGADTEYTIEYYLQQLNADANYTGYYLETASGSTKQTGETNSSVTCTDENLKSYIDPSIFNGYVFDETQTNGQNTSTIKGNGSTKLKLYYKRAQYQVSFNLNKAEGTTGTIRPESVNAITVTYGAPYVIGDDFTKPTRGGYHFEGWSTTTEIGGIIPASTLYNLTDSSTLNAIWTKTTARYTVSVYLQNLGLNKEGDFVDGDFTRSGTDSYNENATTDEELTIEAKQITGFTYASGIASSTDLTLKIDGDGTTEFKLFYTRNKVTITFKVDEEQTQKQYEYGQTITLSQEHENPTKNGYTFDKWVKEGEDTRVETYLVTENPQTFEADFTENSYTINIDKNLTESVANSRAFSRMRTFAAGKTVYKYTESVDLNGELENLKTARVGYSILGFDFIKTPEEANIAFKSTDLSERLEGIPVSEILSTGGCLIEPPYANGSTITLYAIWKVNTYKVEYKDGGVTSPAEFKAYGESFMTKGASEYQKEGYFYVQWKDEKTEETYNVSTLVDMPDHDLILTPDWQKDGFTITYNSNKGAASSSIEGGPVSQTILTYDTEGKIADNTWTLKGYTFNYWYTTSTGSDGMQYTSGEQLDSAKVNALYKASLESNKQITLYAIWTANEYNLRVVDFFNNEQGDHKDITLKYDQRFELNNSDSRMSFTHAGYELVGWNDTAVSGTPKYLVDNPNAFILNALDGVSKIDNDNKEANTITIYAIWQASTKTQYTVQHHREKLDGTFANEGDVDLFEIEYGYGETDTLATAKVRSYDGFHQDLSDGHGDNLSGTISGGEELVLHVYYARNTYSIEFNKNEAGKSGTISALKGGSVDELLKKIENIKFGHQISEYGSLPTAEDIKKNGYEFKGWFTLSSGGEKAITSEDQFNWTNIPNEGTLSLYASWEAGTSNYVVEYYYQQVTGSEYDHDSQNDKTLSGTTDTAISLDEITRLGAKDGFTLDHYVPTPLGVINGDTDNHHIQLYFNRMTYNLTLNREEGISEFYASVNGEDKKAQATRSATYTIPDVRFGSSIVLHSTTEKGYEFDKYYVSEVGGSEQSASFTMPNSNLIVVAAAKVYTYSIKYIANGGTPEADIVDDNGTKNYKYTETFVTKNKENTFTKAGYNLVGWSLKSDNSRDGMLNLGAQYNIKDQVKDDQISSGEITLYAVWEAIHFTFVYHAGDGAEGSMGSDTFTYDDEEKQTLTLVTDQITKNGYNFSKWKLGDETKPGDEETYFNNGQNVYNEYTTDTTIHLWAVWEAKTYQVTFNSNYEGAAPESTTKEFTFDGDNNVMADAVTRTGYQFLGWSLDDGAETQTWTAGETLKDNTISPNGLDVTVYAVYKAHQYVVKYDKGNAKDVDKVTETMQDSTFTYDGRVVLTVNKYKYPGYEFKGWAIEQGSDQVTYDDGAVVENNALYEKDGDKEQGKEKTLYAVWEAIQTEYTVEYYKENVSEVGSYNEVADDSDSFFAKTDTEVTATPSANKYPGFELDTAKNNLTGTVVAGDEKLVIKVYYKRITYHVTFDQNLKNELTGTIGDLPEQASVRYGASLSEVANTDYSRQGYSFDGWYYEAALSQKVEEIDTYDFTNDITVYAKYTAEATSSYTIKYYKEGFTLGSKEYVAEADETKTRILTDSTQLVTPDADKFPGFTAPKGQSKLIRADGTTEFEFIYTRNEYDLTLQKEEGIELFTAKSKTEGYEITTSRENPNVYRVKYEAKIELEITLSKGYSNGVVSFVSGTNADEGYDSEFTLKGDLTLKATATANTYTIVYNHGANGTGEIESGSVAYNTTTDLSDGAGFTYLGYKLIGWALKDNQIEKVYDLSANVSGSDLIEKANQANQTTTYETQEITLYAVWVKDMFTITYKPGDKGVDDQVEYSYEFESSQTYESSDKFTRTGYHYTEWIEENQGDETKVTAGAQFTVEARNITYVPVWVANTYNVTFNANYDGAEPSSTTAQFTFDGKENKMAAALNRVGYMFLGWSLQNDASVQTWAAEETLQDNTISPNGTDVDVYAVWRESIYTINYNAGAKGTGNVKNASVTYTATHTFLDGTGFSRVGYTFIGWAFTDGVSEAKYQASNGILGSTLAKDYAEFSDSYNSEYYPDTTIELYAVWEANTNIKYVVEYYLQNETKDGFEESPAASDEYRNGTADAKQSIEISRTFSGFILSGEKERQTEEIKPDGSTKVRVEFLRMQITVTFDKNEPVEGYVTGEMPEKEVYIYNDKEEKTLAQNKFTLSADHQSEYNFEGWSTIKENAGEPEYTDEAKVNNLIIESCEAGTDENANADVTLYACWSNGQVRVTINIYTQNLDENNVKAVATGEGGLAQAADFTLNSNKYIMVQTGGSSNIEDQIGTYLVDGFNYNKEKLAEDLRNLSVENAQHGSKIDVYLIRNTATLSFNANAVVSGEQTSITVYHGASIQNTLKDHECTYIYKGHTFTYWSYMNENVTTSRGTFDFESNDAQASADANWEANKFTINYTTGVDGGDPDEVTTLDDGATTVSTDYDSSIILPTATGLFTRKGFTLVGFTYGDNHELNNLGESQKVSTLADALSVSDITGSSIELKAKWQENKYTIKVDPKGGTFTFTEQVQDKSTTELVTLGEFNYTAEVKLSTYISNIARAGYDFGGFKFSGNTYQLETSFNRLTEKDGGEVILAAEWNIHTNYTLKVEVKGKDEGDSIEFATAYIGDDKQTQTKTPLEFNAGVIVKVEVQKGYHFVGWFDTEVFTGEAKNTSLTYSFDMPALEENDGTYTLYAVIERDTYSVTYAVETYVNGKLAQEGVVGATLNDTDSANPKEVRYGQTVKFDATFNDGFTIQDNEGGWFINGVTISGESNAYQIPAQDQNGATINITLKVSAISYTIKFEAGADDAVITYAEPYQSGSKEFTIYYSEEHTISEFVSSVTRPGYTFTHFAIDADPTEYKLESTFKNLTTTKNQVVTFTAQYSAHTIEVSFDKDFEGDEQTIESVTLVYGGEAQEIPDTGFTRDGYTLVGWAKTSKGDAIAEIFGKSLTASAFAKALELDDQSHEVTLYAVWEANTYAFNVEVYTQVGNTKTKNNAGGSVTFADTITYDSSVQMTAKANDGYSFVGYYRDESFADQISTELIYNSDIATMKNLKSQAEAEGGMILTHYALFKANLYDITIYTDPKTDMGLEFTLNSEDYGEFEYQSNTGTYTLSIPTSVSIIITAKDTTDYKFEGWYKGNGTTESIQKTTALTTEAMTSAGLVYTIKYTLRTYSLTFKLEATVGGEPLQANSESKTITTGNTINLDDEFNSAFLATMQESKLVLTGWKLNLNDASAKYYYGINREILVTTLADDAGVRGQDDGEITLYAVFSSGKVTINAKASPEQGGTAIILEVGSEKNINESTYEADLYTIDIAQNTAAFNEVKLSANAKNGYKFVSWDKAEPSASNEATATLVNGTNDFTATFIEKQFNYTFGVVTFRAGGTKDTSHVGGEITPTEGSQYKFGAQIGLTATPKAGYTFEGWYLDANCSRTANVESSEDRGVYSGNYTVPNVGNDGAAATLYAKFVAKTFKVTFDGNKPADEVELNWSGVGGYTKQDDTEQYYKSFEYNQAFGSLPTITVEGWSFDGWFTAKEGGEDTQIQSDTICTVDNDNVIYYARYTQSLFDVKLHNYRTTKSSDKDTVVNDNEGGTSTIVSADGVDVNSATGEAQVGKTVTIKATAKEGYLFVGWYTDPTCKTLAAFDEGFNSSSADTSFTMIAEDVDLYAKFEIQSYSVTIHSMLVDATNATELGELGNDDKNVGKFTGNTTYDYKANVQITAKANKDGYSFVGWFKGDDCQEAYFDQDGDLMHAATKSFTMPGKNVDIYAKFVVNSYSVNTYVYTKYTSEASPSTNARGNTFTIDKVIGESANENVTSGKIYYNQEASFTLTLASGYSLVKFYSAYNNGFIEDNKLELEGGNDKYTHTITGETNIYALLIRNSFNVTVESRVRQAASVNTLGELSEASEVGGKVSLQNSLDSASSTATKLVYYGDSFTAYAFASQGFTFIGWYLSTASDTDTNSASQTETTLTLSSLTEGVTYYAIFITNIVNVSVSTGYKNDATGSVSTDIAGSGTDESSLKDLAGKFTLFNNRKSGYFQGQSLTLSVNEVGTGYSFTGWYRYDGNSLGDELDTQNEYAYTVGSKSSTNESIIAIFTRNSFSVSVTARYKAPTGVHELAPIKDVELNNVNNIGGIGTTEAAGNVKISVTVYYGDTLSVYAKKGTRGYYEFAGWFDNASCSTNYGSADTAVKDSPLTTSALTSEAEIYALFLPTDTSYISGVKGQNSTNANTLGELTDNIGGSITNDTKGVASSIYKGQSITFTATASDGFTFLGWFNGADCETKYTAETSSDNFVVSGTTSLTITFSSVTGEFSVYAKFVPTLYNNVTLAVKYLNNGADGELADDTKAGSGTTLSSANKDTETTSYVDYAGVTQTGYYAQNISVTATAGTGYTFKGWFKDIESGFDSPLSDNTTWDELKVTKEAQTIYAVFIRNAVKVTVTTKSGDSDSLTENLTGGKVNSQEVNPLVINTFYGETINLTAKAETGYGFDGFYIGEDRQVEGATIYTFVGTAATYEIEARFTHLTFRVNINNRFITADKSGKIASGADGKVVQEGTTGGSLEGSNSIKYGLNYSATATVTEGYYLRGIYSDADCKVTYAPAKVSGNEVTIEGITSAVNIYALFVLKTYNITLGARKETAKDNSNLNDALSTGGGTLAVATDKVVNRDYGIDGYFVGKPVTLKVNTTDKGYTAGGWFNDLACKNQDNIADSVFTAPNTTENGSTINLYAKFTLNKVMVEVKGFYKNANGTHSLEDTLNALTKTQGSVGVSKEYYYGTTVTLTATASEHWQMPTWYSDATCNTASTNVVVVSDVAEENIRYALFIPEEFTITAKGATRNAASVNTLGNRTIAVLSEVTDSSNGAGKVYYGQTITYTAAARTGYTFVGWYTGTTTTLDGTQVHGATPYTTDEITANDTIFALYIQTPYNVTAEAYYQVASDKDNVLAAPQKGNDGGSVTITTNKFSEYGLSGYFAGTSYSVSLSAEAKSGEGYEFKGWFTEVPTGSNSEVTLSAQYAAPLTSASSPKQYYGLFALKSVTITAKATFRSAKDVTTYQDTKIGDDGGTASGTKTLIYGQSATLVASPKTNLGYVFIGWYEGDQNNSKQIANNSSTSLTRVCTKDETIYARFIVKRIELTVEARRHAPKDAISLSDTLTTGGGTVSIAKVLTSNVNGDTTEAMATTTTAAKGYILYGTAPTLNKQAIEDYEFKNWQTSGGVAYTEKQNLTANTTLYAVFDCVGKYTLTIVNNYKATLTPTTYASTFTEGTTRGSVTLKDSYEFFKGFDILANNNGYFNIKADATGKFEGFYKAKDDAVSKVLTKVNYEELTDGTIYAVFIPNRYSVTLNAVSQTATDALHLGAATPATKDTSVGGNVKFTHAMFTSSTGSATESSNFSRTVSYYGYYGANVSVNATANKNYVVVGWYSDSSCQTAVKVASGTVTTLDASTNPTKSAITLFAKFVTGSFKLVTEVWRKAASTVTGPLATTATKDSSGVSYSSKIADTNYYLGFNFNLEITAKQAYELNGWYSSSSFGTGDKVSESLDTTGFTAGSTVTRYALMVMKTYTVTLDANRPKQNTNTPTWDLINGGWTKAQNNLSVSRELFATETGDVTAAKITIKMLGFKGWYTAPTGGNLISSVKNSAYTDITYYAQWEFGYYTKGRTQSIEGLRNSNGPFDMDLADANDDTGVAGTALTPKQVTGYTFAGWYTNPECTTPVDTSWVKDNKLTVPSGTIPSDAYYAKYERNKETERRIDVFMANLTTGIGYTIGTHGKFSLVSVVGSKEVPIITNSTKTSETFTAYYGETFKLTASVDDNKHYVVDGFNVGVSSNSAPNESKTKSGLPSDSVTFTFYDINTTATQHIHILFRGVEITIKFDSARSSYVEGAEDAVTMPKDQKVYYGTTAYSVPGGYGFNMYAIEYWENTGFEMTEPLSGEMVLTRDTSAFKSNAPMTIDTTKLEIDDQNIVTLYATWDQPYVWLTGYTTGGQVNADTLARGYNGEDGLNALNDAIEAMNSNSSVNNRGEIEILKDISMDKPVNITKYTQISSHGVVPTLTLSGDASFVIKSGDLNIKAVTITGSSTAENGVIYVTKTSANIYPNSVIIGDSTVKNFSISNLTCTTFINVDSSVTAGVGLYSLKVTGSTFGSNSNELYGFGRITSGDATLYVGDITMTNNRFLGNNVFYSSGESNTIYVLGGTYGGDASGGNKNTFDMGADALAYFYVNNATLTFSKFNTSTPTFYISGQRAVYLLGENATASGELDVLQ